MHKPHVGCRRGGTGKWVSGCRKRRAFPCPGHCKTHHLGAGWPAHAVWLWHPRTHARLTRFAFAPRPFALGAPPLRRTRSRRYPMRQLLGVSPAVELAASLGPCSRWPRWQADDLDAPDALDGLDVGGAGWLPWNGSWVDAADEKPCASASPRQAPHRGRGPSAQGTGHGARGTGHGARGTGEQC